MKEALSSFLSFTLSLFQGRPPVLPQIELDRTLAELYKLDNPSNGENRLGYLVCLINSEIEQTSKIPRNTKYLYQETTFATTAIETTLEQRQQLRRNQAIKYHSVAPQHDAFAAGEMPVIFFDPDVDRSDTSPCYLRECAERTMNSLNREQRPKLLCFASPDQILLDEYGIDRFAIKACLDGYEAFPLVVDLETNYFLNTKAALSTSGLPSPKSTLIELDDYSVSPESCCDVCRSSQGSITVPSDCRGTRGSWLKGKIARTVSRIASQELPFVMKTQQPYGGAGTFIVKTQQDLAELQSTLSALILPKLYSQTNAINAHLKPATLIISDLVRDPVGDWGLTFFVTKSGDCVFLAAARQVIGTDSRVWIGSTISYTAQDNLHDRFTPIMRQIGAWLSSHGYYGPCGADILGTAAAAAPEESAADERPVFHIVDLNVRSTGSLVLGLMRGHFSRRRGLHYASTFTISVAMTRDVFIRHFERAMCEGRVVIVSWYEDRETGSSYGRLNVGAETEERLAGEVAVIKAVGSEVHCLLVSSSKPIDKMEYPAHDGYFVPPGPPQFAGYGPSYPGGPPAQYVLPPSLPRPNRRPPSLDGYTTHNARHHGHSRRHHGHHGAPDLIEYGDLPRHSIRDVGRPREQPYMEEPSDSASSDTESDNDLEAVLTLPLEQRNGKSEPQEYALILDDELQPPPRPRESVAPKNADPFNVTCYDVFHSTFTGDTHGPGDTRAQLATTTGDTTRPQPEGSLFRWIHLQSQNPSFDAFIRFASSKLHLDEVPHQNTVALLRQVQQDYEHQSPSSATSSKGRQLQPNFTQQKSMRGNIMMDSKQPSLKSGETHFIHVFDEHGRTWLLPPSRCQSWLQFIANFRELSPEFEEYYNVVYNGATVRSDVWKSVVSLAYRKTLKLALRSQRKGETIIRRPSPHRSVSLELFHPDRQHTEYNLVPRSAGGSDSERDDQAPAEIGTSADSLDIRSPAETSRESLEMLTDEGIDGERNKPNLRGKRGEKMQASTGQFYLLYWLAAVVIPESNEPTSSSDTPNTQKSPGKGTTQGQDSFEVDTSRLNDLLSEIHIALRSQCLGKNAKHVHSKQLPPPRSLREVQIKLTAISRAPIDRLVKGFEVPNPESPGSHDIEIYFVNNVEIHLEEGLRCLTHEFEHGPMPGTFDMPKVLRTLALKLLSLSTIGLTEKPRKVLMSRVFACSKLTARGRKELFRSLAPDKLETKEAALPSGILTLLLKNVSQDITKDTLDTQFTYSEYILKLEQDIQRKPYSRSHQEKLNNVRQEIYCVLECLASQSQVVNELEEFLQNLVRIESSKDRQEAAIFVFTVVTIIFLPLSFVASFFGMNVNDIRDMGRSQWVFWASALPLTAIVAAVAILVAYKIEPVKDLWSGIAERWRGRDTPAQSYPPQAPVTRQASYYRPHVVDYGRR
ncbi:MAG: hypothetical protein Q9212_005562 [Teloschistes hypoglaucus]